jgi:hypothetical protein
LVGGKWDEENRQTASEQECTNWLHGLNSNAKGVEETIRRVPLGCQGPESAFHPLRAISQHAVQSNVMREHAISTCNAGAD